MNSIMETVCVVCTTVRNNSKTGASFQKLLGGLRREFRLQGFDILIRTVRKKTLLPEEFYVNAYYDPIDDHNGDTAIEVIAYHNFAAEVEWDREHITSLFVQIFDAIIHEFKHQRQSRKRHYEPVWPDATSTHEYLSEPDELDAYSLSIAIELCRSLGKNRALRYMGKITSLSRLKFQDHYVSPNLYFYFKQFGNLSHPTLRSLAKKVYIRIQKVDTDAIFV